MTSLSLCKHVYFLQVKSNTCVSICRGLPYTVVVLKFNWKLQIQNNFILYIIGMFFVVSSKSIHDYHEDIEDQECPGRPSTSSAADNVEKEGKWLRRIASGEAHKVGSQICFWHETVVMKCILELLNLNDGSITHQCKTFNELDYRSHWTKNYNRHKNTVC